MFTFPPTGTAERWGCVSKLVLAGLALAFACWSLTAPGSSGPTMKFIPVLAVLMAGLLVWDAATWKTKKPGRLYLIPCVLYKLVLLPELVLNGQPVTALDYGFPLVLTALVVFSFMDDRRERTDG